MSAADDKKLSARYRAAPRAESPDHLDARILQTARDHAPAPSARRGVPWAPALASACLAGLALYVVTPLLNTDPAGTAPMQADAPLREQERSMEAADAVQTGRTAAPVMAPTANSAPGPVSEEPAVQQTDELKPRLGQEAAPKQRSESFAGEAEGLNRSSAAVAASPDALLDVRKREDDDSVTDKASALRTSSLPPSEIDRRINEITALANRELIEEAQRLLDELIARCPDCALPESIAELQLQDATPQYERQ